MARRTIILAMITITVVGYFVAVRLFKGFSPIQALTFPLAPSPSELCEAGRPITLALRKYRNENGRYPASLADARITASSTFFGPWIYRCHEEGESCELSNGDYARFLFVVSWTPKGEWYVDN